MGHTEHGHRVTSWDDVVRAESSFQSSSGSMSFLCTRSLTVAHMTHSFSLSLGERVIMSSAGRGLSVFYSLARQFRPWLWIPRTTNSTVSQPAQGRLSDGLPAISELVQEPTIRQSLNQPAGFQEPALSRNSRLGRPLWTSTRCCSSPRSWTASRRLGS